MIKKSPCIQPILKTIRFPNKPNYKNLIIRDLDSWPRILSENDFFWGRGLYIFSKIGKPHTIISPTKNKILAVK